MRFFWSVVLTGGLLLVGLDVYQASLEPDQGRPSVARAEDGTPLPTPPPPPPPR